MARSAAAAAAAAAAPVWFTADRQSQENAPCRSLQRQVAGGWSLHAGDYRANLGDVLRPSTGGSTALLLLSLLLLPTVSKLGQSGMTSPSKGSAKGGTAVSEPTAKASKGWGFGFGRGNPR